MYTTKTAGREQVLKAVAAAQRAMERHACCKSQFKFKCFSCGEMINRGDRSLAVSGGRRDDSSAQGSRWRMWAHYG